jgi:hypothetical protein
MIVVPNGRGKVYLYKSLSENFSTKALELNWQKNSVRTIEGLETSKVCTKISKEKVRDVPQ